MKTRNLYFVTLVILFALFFVSTQTRTLARSALAPCAPEDTACHNIRRNPPPPPTPPAWNITLGSFTDSRDGQTYRTVKMPDGKWWMAENLNYDTLDRSGSWCYDNNPDNCNVYGRMYNWVTAIEACPAGWHLPDTAEWNAMVDAAGGSYTAGTLLKSRTHWRECIMSNGLQPSGTDHFGFSALPAGFSYANNYFQLIEYAAIWWTASTADYPTQAYVRGMSYCDGHVTPGFYHIRNSHFSVRCVKDER